VLFAQNASVIDQQRDLVTRQLVDGLGVAVEFASSPEDVSPGAQFDAVIAPTVPWLPELLARTSGVGWIHFLSSGVEKIWGMKVDWSAYTLTSSKGVHAVPISEYVLGAMLHFAKRFDQFTAQSQEALWQREWLSELTGAEVLIVGAGSIGRAVAERCRFLGMRPRLLARTARRDSEFGDVLGFDDLAMAVATADYLVVAVPLTPATTGLINDDILACLKPGAVLVDVSRGGVVPDTGVARALDGGALRGVAKDVFDEQPLPSDSPLWGRANVLLTPHVAGTTPKYMERALTLFVENAHLLLRGAEPKTLVVQSAGY
jgi:phosphoglycerate dehydrogenase-like enzyme